MPGAGYALTKQASSRIEILPRGLGADGLGVAVASAAAAAAEAAAAAVAIGAFSHYNRLAGSAEPRRLLTTRARTQNVFQMLGARSFARLIGRIWQRCAMGGVAPRACGPGVSVQVTMRLQVNMVLIFLLSVRTGINP